MKGVPLGRASRYAVTFGGAGAVLSTVPLPSQGSITRRDPATYVPGPNEELVTFANTQDAGFGSRIVHYDFADAWVKEAATGLVEVNGVKAKARDGLAIRDEDVIRVTALEDAELVLVDAA